MVGHAITLWQLGKDREMNYPEYLEPCPACGDHADYCQGHGEIGDPAGHAILVAHYDRGEHDRCHPLADCEG